MLIRWATFNQAEVVPRLATYQCRDNTIRREHNKEVPKVGAHQMFSELSPLRGRSHYVSDVGNLYPLRGGPADQTISNLRPGVRGAVIESPSELPRASLRSDSGSRAPWRLTSHPLVLPVAPSERPNERECVSLATQIPFPKTAVGPVEESVAGI